MEVHTHPHHVTHKKKWGEYLLEFFMLFLAVFLGFVAENIRENTVEKNRAKELSSALIIDLQKDEVQISNLRIYRNSKRQTLDTFYRMLHQPFSNIDRVRFYTAAKFIQSNLYFTAATGTSNELKSAGYLRYFVNTKLASLLSDYEATYLDCAGDEEVENDLLYNHYYESLRKVSDPSSFDSLFNYPQNIRGIGITLIKPEDLAELQKIIAQVKYMNSVFIRKDGQFDKLNKKETEIIQYLKEEYHLENE